MRYQDHISQGSGNITEEAAERLQTLEVRERGCEVLSSRCDMVAVLMKSQQLWLSAQDKYCQVPVTSLSRNSACGAPWDWGFGINKHI